MVVFAINRLQHYWNDKQQNIIIEMVINAKNSIEWQDQFHFD